KQPTVIQICAENDKWIKHDDSLDIDQFPKAGVEVIASSHTTIPILPKGREADRYARLKNLILHRQGDPSTGATDDKVQDIVFLVHGIRSSTGDWPKRAAELI